MKLYSGIYLPRDMRAIVDLERVIGGSFEEEARKIHANMSGSLR